MIAMTLLIACLADDPVRIEPEDLGRRHHGQRVLIDDRISSVLGEGNSRQFRLRRCPNVTFQIGDKGPKSLEGNARVVGVARFERNNLRVDVESISLLPTDLEEFQVRSQAIAKDNPKGWYELADWARKRSRTYSDPAMEKKAVQAYARGIEIERGLAADNAETLRSLRDRLIHQEFLNADLTDIDHAILWAEFKSKSDRSPDELERFADRLVQTLDPERTALPGRLDAHLARRYLDDPIGTFREARTNDRPSFVRAWEVQLRRDAWDARVSANPIVEGYKAWEWSKEALRDEPDVGRSWLAAAIEAETAKSSDFDKDRFRKLTERIRTDARDPDRATLMERDWLSRGEQRMREEERRQAALAKRAGRTAPPPNVRGRYDIALVWLEWFGDQEVERPAALLLEAVTIEPDFEPAAKELRRLGYARLADSRWVSPEEARKVVKEDNGPRAITEGMDADRVVEILGEPDSRCRFITGKDLIEHHWTYRTAAGPLGIILLSRPNGPPRVQAVHRSASR